LRRFRLRKFLIALSCSLLFCSSLVSANAKVKASGWEIPSRNFSADTAGFATPFSALPGETIGISLTCTAPSFFLTIYRMGFYGGAGGKLVMKTQVQPCNNQTQTVMDRTTHFVAEKWNVTTRLETSKLSPGMYLARINASDGHESFVPFVLKDKITKNRIVISVPFQTSLAYNTYTGQSAYGKNGNFSERARVLSFSAPFSEGYGSGIYYFYLQPLVKLVDQLNLNPSYVADTDIAQNSHVLDGVKVLISGGHDEYWTLEERQNVINARSLGMNLLLFGANAEYWRTRLTSSAHEGGLRMEIYKSKSEDPNKLAPTVKYLDQGMPESLLTYQNYNCFKPKGEFQVSNPNAFIFNGTGAARGSIYKGIMGPEIDHELPTDSFFGKRYVLNRSLVRCGRYPWDQISSSTIVLGVIPNAGGTVSIGDMNWIERGLTTGVSKTTLAFVRKVTSNILLTSALGPMGKLNLKVG